MNSRLLSMQILTSSLQAALILLVAIPAIHCIGFRNSKYRLACYQALLMGILLLPWIGSFLPMGTSSLGIPSFRIEAVLDGALPSAPELWVPSPHLAVLLAFALVAGFLLMRLVFAWRALRDLTVESIPYQPAPRVFNGLMERLKTAAELRISSRVKTPVSLGWSRPVILVPDGFQQLLPPHQEAILCHELLHISRRDWPVALIEQGLRALLWFNPAVVVLLNRIQLSREEVVDSETVRITCKRREYLETLRLAAESLRGPGLPSPVSFLRGCHLKKRVARLTQEVPMSTKRDLLSSILVVAVVIGVSTLVLAALPVGNWRLSPFPSALTPSISNPQPQDSKESEREGHIEVADEVNVRIRLVKKVNPVYPEDAKKEQITGRVRLDATIDKTGKVVEVKVVDSPHDSLSKSASDAVLQWEYEPPLKDGKPVSVKVTVTINYQLS